MSSLLFVGRARDLYLHCEMAYSCEVYQAAWIRTSVET